MMTTMSVIRSPEPDQSERLILDKKGTEDKDPLDEN